MSTNWPRMALAGATGLVAFVGVALIVQFENRLTDLEVQVSILKHGKRGARAGGPDRPDRPPPPDGPEDGPREDRLDGPPDGLHEGPPDGAPEAGKGAKRGGLGGLHLPGSAGIAAPGGEPTARALRVESVVLDFIEDYEIDEDRADRLVAVYSSVSDNFASIRDRQAAGELDNEGANRARQAVRKVTRARLDDLLDIDEREALMLEVQEAAASDD